MGSIEGGEILYCPDRVCRHIGGASLSGRSQDVVRFWESLYAFYGKHYGIRRAIFLKRLLTLGFAAEYYLCRIKQEFGLAEHDLPNI